MKLRLLTYIITTHIIFISLHYLTTIPLVLWGNLAQKDPSTIGIPIQQIAVGISAGVPQGLCSITYHDQVIEQNFSTISKMQTRLSLFASHINAAGDYTNYNIECLDSLGFKGWKTRDLVILPHVKGQVVQLIRIVNDVILGPMMALILFAIVLFVFISEKAQGQRSDGNHISYAIFAIVSVIYASSLAGIFRLLMPSGTYFALFHTIIRVAFSACTLRILSRNKYILSPIYVLHFVMAVILITSWSIYAANFNTIYDFVCLLFPTTMLINTILLARKRDGSDIGDAYFALSASWTVGLCLDVITRWSREGAYYTPQLLAVLNIFLIVLRLKDSLLNQRVQNAVSRALTIIESNSSLKDILAQIARVTSFETHFSRVSAYIDGSAIGLNVEPRRNFVRVLEHGYKKDTSKDREIRFEDGRGTAMQEAILLNKPILKKGTRDQSWYVVLPIGEHAVINLSDDHPRPEHQAFESLEIIRRLQPALKPFASKLLQYTHKQGLALDKLRTTYGLGKHDVQAGSLCADINNFSLCSLRYGDSFLDFIATRYMPNLVRVLTPLALPEYIKGDEVHFIILPTIPGDAALTAQTIEVARRFVHFSKGEGAALCTGFGYEPLTFSVGISMGRLVISVDETKTRASGNSIIESKRLQEAAPPDAIYVKQGIFFASLDNKSSFTLTEPFPILVKKNTITANRLILKDQAA